MLTDKQLMALNLLVYEGKLKKEAAEAVGVTPGTISEWFRSEEFLSQHEKMLRSIHKEMADKATKRLAQLIDDDQSSTALGAVKLTLSIAGYDPVAKTEIKSDNFTVEFKGKTPNESNSK